MTHRLPSVLCTAVAAGALALTGCGGPAPSSGSSQPSGAAVGVVASTDVYGSIASAVGGEHVKVTSLIHSPDADPHEYETTASDAAAAGEAKVLIANGGGYDDFVGKLSQATGGKATLVDVSELSGLRTGAGEFNEHVWYHLPTMAKLADRLAAELSKADPADAAAYQANAAAFKAKLDGLSAQVNAIKSGHPGARVAVTEPVPLYLVEAAGMTNATPEEFSEAVEKGSDPPAAVLNQTLALFNGPGKVGALLANAQTESPATKQVEQAANQGGVPVVKMTETLPAGTMDYVTWMGGQINALAGAMDRR
ncbi:metal ABC transporter solute-binding protein, Zn/Mn family [Pseudonocardia acaciae]|uniref:metal ABC transporter solute-binding protein, Zn/Mn family n=1 Tax=Pseudonocardia acaciae TaxID=551276 RepID=UPI00048C832F|nr:zinc ABC transporter substrate-binding protein [Pseudonocardia acaciae]